MENYITLSHLNDFIFCPRSIYFHQLYSIYNEQNYKQRPQIAGTEAHSAIDNSKYSTKSTILQGIEVYFEKYNILPPLWLSYLCLKHRLNFYYCRYVQ